MSTLDLDMADRVSGVLALCAVLVFCILIQVVVTDLSREEVLILWAVAGGYVSVVLLTLGLHRARHTQWLVEYVRLCLRTCRSGRLIVFIDFFVWLV
jgi:hypothetical protein